MSQKTNRSQERQPTVPLSEEEESEEDVTQQERIEDAKTMEQDPDSSDSAMDVEGFPLLEISAEQQRANAAIERLSHHQPFKSSSSSSSTSSSSSASKDSSNSMASLDSTVDDSTVGDRIAATVSRLRQLAESKQLPDDKHWNTWAVLAKFLRLDHAESVMRNVYTTGKFVRLSDSSVMKAQIASTVNKVVHKEAFPATGIPSLEMCGSPVVNLNRGDDNWVQTDGTDSCNCAIDVMYCSSASFLSLLQTQQNQNSKVIPPADLSMLAQETSTDTRGWGRVFTSDTLNCEDTKTFYTDCDQIHKVLLGDSSHSVCCSKEFASTTVAVESPMHLFPPNVVEYSNAGVYTNNEHSVCIDRMTVLVSKEDGTVPYPRLDPMVACSMVSLGGDLELVSGVKTWVQEEPETGALKCESASGLEVYMNGKRGALNNVYLYDEWRRQATHSMCMLSSDEWMGRTRNRCITTVLQEYPVLCAWWVWWRPNKNERSVRLLRSGLVAPVSHLWSVLELAFDQLDEHPVVFMNRLKSLVFSELRGLSDEFRQSLLKLWQAARITHKAPTNPWQKAYTEVAHTVDKSTCYSEVSEKTEFDENDTMVLESLAAVFQRARIPTNQLKPIQSGPVLRAFNPVSLDTHPTPHTLLPHHDAINLRDSFENRMTELKRDIQRAYETMVRSVETAQAEMNLLFQLTSGDRKRPCR